MITVPLRSGTLTLAVERAELPLAELCGFASRRSRKRGFVFVSKVLGKHYPVRPRIMADIHARLAAKLQAVTGPTVLIALAETATGLGQGVYEAWQAGRGDVLFLHSTRYRLRRPPALAFDENHSHAPAHLLYEPADPDHAELFGRAETLILVDDELTTGRTLVNLAVAYRRRNPRLRAVHFVCLTDWLGADRRAALAADVGVPITVHSLLQGTYTFRDNPEFDPGPIPDAVGRGEFRDDILPVNHGRLGVVGPRHYDLDDLIKSAGVRPGQRLLVLGSGEFAHPPFLLARRLEEHGWDVWYQSTTRSPLLVGGDLTSVLEFPDNYGDGIANYVYNVADRRYDHVLIGYETRPLPAGHSLPGTLGAAVVLF